MERSPMGLSPNAWIIERYHIVQIVQYYLDLFIYNKPVPYIDNGDFESVDIGWW